MDIQEPCPSLLVHETKNPSVILDLQQINVSSIHNFLVDLAAVKLLSRLSISEQGKNLIF